MFLTVTRDVGVVSQGSHCLLVWWEHMHTRGSRAGPCGAEHGVDTALDGGTGVLASSPAHSCWAMSHWAGRFPAPYLCVLTHGSNRQNGWTQGRQTHLAIVRTISEYQKL